jgi:hypothetical protein
MSIQYENIFERVGNAKKLANWEPSLPKGRHRVALAKYGGKTSAKDRSIFLEAEVIILESDNEAVKPGARHSCPWFINKPDEYGYTHSRAKEFLLVVQQSIGNEAETTKFGNDLAQDFESSEPEAYGLMLDVVVTQVLKSDGQPRFGRKGNEVFNANWLPVPQSQEDIAATRALLKQLETRRTAAPVATAVEPPAPTNGKKLGGLGSLLGKTR